MEFDDKIVDGNVLADGETAATRMAHELTWFVVERAIDEPGNSEALERGVRNVVDLVRRLEGRLRVVMRDQRQLEVSHEAERRALQSDLEYQKRVRRAHEDTIARMEGGFQIRFDGPPNPRVGGRAGSFVEVEDLDGNGIRLGRWVQDCRDWLLVVDRESAKELSVFLKGLKQPFDPRIAVEQGEAEESTRWGRGDPLRRGHGPEADRPSRHLRDAASNLRSDQRVIK